MRRRYKKYPMKIGGVYATLLWGGLFLWVGVLLLWGCVRAVRYLAGLFQ